eukprot:1904070-Pyramimonas_sp.AAC.1
MHIPRCARNTRQPAPTGHLNTAKHSKTQWRKSIVPLVPWSPNEKERIVAQCPLLIARPRARAPARAPCKNLWGSRRRMTILLPRTEWRTQSFHSCSGDRQ